MCKLMSKLQKLYINDILVILNNHLKIFATTTNYSIKQQTVAILKAWLGKKFKLLKINY